MNDPRGSSWRKWDLHFHTPSSFDYADMSVTDEQIVSKLRDSGIGVVAVTDHHRIDVARIKSLQALAGQDLTVLPGIELRSELGGGQSVHFVGIFPEDCDLEEVWLTLQVELGISPKQVREKTDERVYCDLEDSAKVIHDLGGVVTVHAGRKSNSIERIKNAEEFKQALKTDLVKTSIDIYEIGHPEDQQPYQEKVFPHIGVLPMILGSDNHDVKKYSLPHPCWIKADPTFKGLLQVLQEPEDRICIGVEPPKLRLVRETPTRFIRAIHIEKIPGSSLAEEWFGNVSIPLSPDLVAIIGNKGSGKSALADIIGLLGASKQESQFSFLNLTKFRQAKGNRARYFQATIEWESGSKVTKVLNNSVQPHEVEAVRYIPQNYLELLCNEIGGSEEGSFDRELEKVIFTHVALEDRLGHATLKDLIGYKTEQLSDAATILRSELHKVNLELSATELQLSARHRAALQAKLLSKQQELDAHCKLEPAPVDEPRSEDSELQKTAAEIEIKTELLQKYQAAVTDAQTRRHEHFRHLAVLQRLNERLDNFQRQYETFCAECAEEASLLGMRIGDIIELKVDRQPLAQVRKSHEDQLDRLALDLNPDHQGSAMASVNSLVQEIEVLHGRLDEPNVRYQAYRDATSTWTRRKAEIIGDAEQPDTLAYYESQLKALDDLPKRVDDLRKRSLNLTREIHRTLCKIVDVYRQLYQPVQRFIEDHPLVRDKFQLNFEVSLVDNGFKQGFLDFINQAVVGSFAGIEEGRQIVNRLLQKCDFTDEEQVIAFINEVLSLLIQDARQEKPRPVELPSQLRKGVQVGDLYDFLFSLGFLSPRYVLKLGGSLPGQLSPGEKGTLLLIFYLLLDSDGIPLIIDQPEENLDNQTVYDLLVPSIKEAKKRRQVIIVTHNPNLAVVCDAEQVVYANQDKARGFRIAYQSGAIEKPEINKRILDVLEGTLPAFRNRGFKYRPHQNV